MNYYLPKYEQANNNSAAKSYLTLKYNHYLHTLNIRT